MATAMNDESHDSTDIQEKPIQAKRLMREVGAYQQQLSDYLTLEDGSHLSIAAINKILNKNIWPKRKTSKAILVQQLKAFLRTYEIEEERIETAAEEDDGSFQPRLIRQDRARLKPTNAPIIDDETQLPENVMLTQTARKHFQLFRDPFLDDVQSSEDIFLAPDQRYIREYMFDTAKHGGFLAVVGESGAGKSVLRRDLLDRIRREGQEITPIMPRIIDKERLTAGAICDAIINDISQEAPKCSLEAKGRQIEQLLTGSSRSGSNHVLIVEEAHDLTIPTLKYLKRFWELEDGFKRLLSIILIGQPELKAKLDERQNWQAREVIRRIEVAELEPLNSNIEGYLKHKFNRINRKLPDLFAQDAFDAMQRRLTYKVRGSNETTSMAYPLVINNLVVKCLNLAAEIGDKTISAEIIKEV